MQLLRYQDKNMASIERRTTPSGQTSFRVKVRLKGTRPVTATFNRLTDAKRWAQQTEAAVREGRHFKTSEAKRHTLAETIDRYVKSIIPRKPKSARDQTTQLQWWKDNLGQYSLADVTPALISEHHDKLNEGITTRNKPRSTATVNRYLAALRVLPCH